jgi:hypothetical protein
MAADEPKHESPESVHPQDTPRDEGDSAPREPPVIPHVPPPPTNIVQPNQCRYEPTPPWQKIAEISAVVIALLLLVVNVGFLIVNICQSRATQKAANTAAKQLEMSERPWLSVPDVKIENVDTSDPKHPRLTLSFVVENTGNSIATLETLRAVMWPDPDTGNGAKPYGQNAANFSKEPVDSSEACRNQPDDPNKIRWGILQNAKPPFEVELDYSFEIEDPSRPIDLRITGCLLYTDHLGIDATRGLHFTPFMAGFANKEPGKPCPGPNPRNTSEYWVTYSNQPTEDRLCVRYVEIGPIDGITP